MCTSCHYTLSLWSIQKAHWNSSFWPWKWTLFNMGHFCSIQFQGNSPDSIFHFRPNYFNYECECNFNIHFCVCIYEPYVMKNTHAQADISLSQRACKHDSTCPHCCRLKKKTKKNSCQRNESFTGGGQQSPLHSSRNTWQSDCTASAKSSWASGSGTLIFNERRYSAAAAPPGLPSETETEHKREAD